MPKQPLQTLVRHLHKLVRPSEDGPADGRDLLLRFIKHQDSLAFAALVERHGPMVRGVCRRLLRQESDVDDAFQATFLVLLRKAHTIRKTQSLGSWLYGVAFRIASRARTESSRRPGHNRQGVPLAASRQCHTLPSDPVMEAAWRELCAVLDAEVHGLVEKFRAPIVLCYLEGQTRDQAARQLGWSLRTLDRRLEEGRERLRVRLARRGITLSAALLATGLSQQAGLCAIPPALLEQTLQAACGLASGQTAAAISPKAIVLAETVLKGAVPVQLKILAGVFLVVAVGVAGAGALARQMLAAKPQAASEAKDSKPTVGNVQQAKDEPAKPLRTDLYGDPLPPGAIARLGTVRFRTAGDWSKIVFSGDGKTLNQAAASKIYTWEADTGKPLRQFPVGKMNAEAFDLSADGKIAATAWVTSVTLWDTTNGKPIHTIERRQDEGLQGLALSPDGKLVASASQRNKAEMIFLWEVKTGNESLKLPVTGPCCFAFSPDGKNLVSADAEFLRFWDLATRREACKLPVPEQGLTCLAFSADSQILALGGPPGTIWLWRARRPQEVRKFLADQGWIHSLALAPTGRMLALAAERGLRLWDVATGKEVPSLQNRPDFSISIAFSPDGKTLAGAAPIIRLWDVTTGKELQPRAAHQLWVNSLAFTPDGKTVASTGPDSTIRLWEAASGKPLHIFSGHRDSIDSVAFCPDGDTLVSESSDNTVRVWQLRTGQEIRQFSFGGNSPDKSPLYQPMGMALSTDGKTVTEVSRGMHVNVYGLIQVHTWEVATGRLVLQRREPLEREDRVVPRGLSPDGKILVLEPLPTKDAGSNRGKPLVLWDIAHKRNLLSLQGHEEGSSGYPKVFSPDGQTVAAFYSEPVIREGKKTFQSAIRLWEVVTGKKVLDLPTGSGRCLAFSGDGRILAAGGDGNIRLWDVASGRELLRLQGYEGGLYALAFSRDRKLLASAHGDTTALVWDMTPLGERGVLTPRLSPKELSSGDIDQFWADLGSEDAPRAHAALWALVASPNSAVGALQRLQPAKAPDPKLMTRLLADLDSDRFPVREAAAKELAKLGEQVEPVLRQVLERKPSAEVRKRLDTILSGPPNIPTGETLQALRAVRILEHIGTPQAQQVLKTLAAGAPEARLTQEAKAALERLARRPASTP